MLLTIRFSPLYLSTRTSCLPHHPSQTLSPTSNSPARIAHHCPLLSPEPQLHDYSAEHSMLHRLARATWPSGKPLHCVTSAELRRLHQQHSSSKLTARLHHWTSTPGFVPTDTSRWQRIWSYNRDSKESCLMWKILFHSNATQRWRFPKVPNSDPRLACSLCLVNAVEDEQHIFWSCPYASKIWLWAIHILQLRSGSTWEPGIEHVLLGNVLPQDMRHLQHWWDLFRGSVLWNIWLHRNAVVFQTRDAVQPKTAIACKVWIKMRQYIRLDFLSLRRKLVTANNGHSARLISVFKRTWGPPPLGPVLCIPNIDLPAVPALSILA